MTAEEKLGIAVRVLDEKKGRDLQAIHVSGLTIIGDYFLFATAASAPHVRALAEEVEDRLASHDVEPNHIEGRASGWILLDYGDLVIHIFDQQSREFYQVERLWADGEPVDLSAFLTTAEGDNA